MRKLVSAVLIASLAPIGAAMAQSGPVDGKGQAGGTNNTGHVTGGSDSTMTTRSGEQRLTTGSVATDRSTASEEMRDGRMPEPRENSSAPTTGAGR